MELQRVTVPFEIKQADVNDDMGKFKGYGAIFGNIDLGGDIIRGGALLSR